MSPTDIALAAQIIELAGKLGAEVAKAVSDAISSKRPELVPAPPVEQGTAIESEDDLAIRKRFLSG